MCRPHEHSAWVVAMNGPPKSTRHPPTARVHDQPTAPTCRKVAQCAPARLALAPLRPGVASGPACDARRALTCKLRVSRWVLGGPKMTKIRKFPKWPEVVRACRAGSPGTRRSFFHRISRSWRREMVENVPDLTVGHHGARDMRQKERPIPRGVAPSVPAVRTRARRRASHLR